MALVNRSEGIGVKANSIALNYKARGKKANIRRIINKEEPMWAFSIPYMLDQILYPQGVDITLCDFVIGSLH